MNFRYDIFPEQRIVVMRYVGNFNLRELTTAAELLWSDPRYSRSYDGLADISHASVNVAMTDFRPLVDFVRQHAQTSAGRWAAVATTPLATACGFIYQRAAASRHTFEIFSTWEGACSFLKLDLEPTVTLTCGLDAEPLT